MRKLSLRFIHFCLLLSVYHFSASSQATKLTNLSSGSFSIGAANNPPTNQNLYLYGNSFYFIGRSAADAQEWYKLDLSNNTIAQATSNHSQISGSVIFRDPVRFGDNVFVGSSAAAGAQDIEFSRFNLATATEQRMDVYTGNNASNPAVFNQSDPIQYVRAANGRIYFRPLTGGGNQIHYWDPTTQTITKLTSYNEPTGLSQNTAASMFIIGDTLYTAINSGSASALARINIINGNVTTFTLPAYVTALKSMSGKIYFSARATATTGIPYNLYVYNPATGLITRLSDYPTTAPTTTGMDALRDLFVGNDGKTLFVNVGINVSSSTNGDFFSVNTQTDVVTNRNIGVSSASTPDRCFYLHSVGNYVYVVRQTSSTRGIYKINLNTNEATLISANNFTSIRTNTFSTSTNVLDPINGRIYLVASEGVYGSEVYELNLNTDEFTRLTDINTSGDSGPTALGFYNSKLYVFASATGTSSPDYEFYSVPVAQILPLKWISFTAIPSYTGSVQIEWKVAEQQGVKNFVLETSADGNSWNAIATVAATANNGYQYQDKARGAKVVYYRIKEVSADGSYTYSEVRKVLTQGKGGAFVLLNNPSKSNTITVGFAAVAAKGALTVTDASGRIVANKNWNGGAGTVQVKVAGTGTYNVNFDTQNLRAVVQ